MRPRRLHPRRLDPREERRERGERDGDGLQADPRGGALRQSVDDTLPAEAQRRDRRGHQAELHAPASGSAAGPRPHRVRADRGKCQSSGSH